MNLSIESEDLAIRMRAAISLAWSLLAKKIGGGLWTCELRDYDGGVGGANLPGRDAYRCDLAAAAEPKSTHPTGWLAGRLVLTRGRHRPAS